MLNPKEPGLPHFPVFSLVLLFGTLLVVVSNATPPPRPLNLTITAKDAHTVTIAWDNAAGVEVQDYQILKDGEPFGFSATNSFLCAGLATDIPYTFRVQARDEEGNLSDSSNAVIATPQAGVTEVHPAVVRTSFRALVINYDPVARFGGLEQRVGEHYGYRDVDTLISQYISLLKKASSGQTVWSVAYRFDLDEFPLPSDHNKPAFTAATYADLLSQGYDYWNNGGPDYHGILRDPRFDLIGKINAGDIDAVWIFSVFGTGFWETAMAGPSPYWINGGPIPDSVLTRNVVFYGFGKEGHQGVGFMCENTAHMTENIIRDHIAREWPRNNACQSFATLNLDNPTRHLIQRSVNDWTHFTQGEAASWDPALVAPGQSQAGLSHFPPVAAYNYDWNPFQFNFDNLNAFRVYDGSWTAGNQECRVAAGTSAKIVAFDGMGMSDELGAYHPPMAFSDVDMEVNIRVMNDAASAHAGVLFRLSRCQAGVDQFTGYYAGINPNQKQVFLWRVDSARSVIAQSDYSLSTNTNYRLRMEARGPRIKLFLDGSLIPILEAAAPSYITGGFGLAASSTEAFFSDWSIVPHSFNHADNWYKYPEGGNRGRDFSALDWNGDTPAAMDYWYGWWWEHLPKNGGGHFAVDLEDGSRTYLLNTWWPYVFDINRFTRTLPFPDIVFPPEDLTAPEPPTLLQGIPLGATQTALSWNAPAGSPDVTRYAVFRDGRLLRTTVQPFFKDTRLSPLSRYSYMVKSWDGAGNVSSASPEIAITTLEADVQGQLLNGGFEAEPQMAGWVTDAYLPGAAAFNWETEGRRETRCASIDGSKFNDARWGQTIKGLTPGTTYWLAGWIRGEDVIRDKNSGVGANLCLLGTWDHTSQVLDGTFDWTRVVLGFTAPASGSISVGCRLGYWGNLARGKVWFDDVTILQEKGELAITQSYNGEIRITFYGLPDRTCTIQTSSDLVHWQNLSSDTTDAQGTCRFEATPAASRGFYRVAAP